MARELSAGIVDVADLSAAQIALWKEIVSDDPLYLSPFFQPAFTQAVARVAPDTAVAVLRCAGADVGFFPFQRRGETIQPIGAPLNDYHGVIARAEHRLSLELIPELIGVGSLAVTGWVGEPGAVRAIEHQSVAVAMSGGWDAYQVVQRQAWRKFFGDKDRARRSLSRDRGEITLHCEQATSGNLDRLVALKRQQYRRSGRHDVFACGWTVDLLRSLLDWSEDGFGGTLAILSAGGEPVAYEYGLCAGQHYHFWFPAYELTAARYSPGTLLSLDTMREKSKAGVSTFDFGDAGEPYKKYFCNRTGRIFEGAASRPDMKGALRSAVLTTRLGQSVHRRWKTIAGCETSLVGLVAGLATAARSMATSRAAAGPEPATIPMSNRKR